MFQNKEKEELNTIESQLEKCQKLRDEYLTGWKRERASFLNYKKEETERISKITKFANEELISEFLHILDSIYIAEEKLSQNLKENQWVIGILRIKTQILNFLKKEGVEEMKVLGKKFDPNFQEIVGETKKKGFEPGIVVEEIERGYILGDKVIRAAKVRVAK